MFFYRNKLTTPSKNYEWNVSIFLVSLISLTITFFCSSSYYYFISVFICATPYQCTFFLIVLMIPTEKKSRETAVNGGYWNRGFGRFFSTAGVRPFIRFLKTFWNRGNFRPRYIAVIQTAVSDGFFQTRFQAVIFNRGSQTFYSVLENLLKPRFELLLYTAVWNYRGFRRFSKTE
jgi:hypothetical protein